MKSPRIYPARTWKSADGKFSVEAEFVFTTSSKVKLRKLDGEEITVARDKLSAEDEQWIKDLSR